MALRPFREVVNEVFDRPAPWKLVHDEETFTKYTFVSKDIKYIVLFDGGEDSAHISFMVSHDAAAGSIKSKISSKGTQGILDTGNAVEVFSTVISVIRDYHKKHGASLDYYAFVGHEPSRMMLYKRLANNMAKELGWQFKQTSADWDGHGQVFKIYRKASSKKSIHEVFDRPAKWNKLKDGYHFTIKDKWYTVKFERFWIKLPKGQEKLTVDITFWMNKDMGDDHMDRLLDVTGTGDEIAVFATVVDIVKDYHSKEGHIVDEYTFSGMEYTRQKLYQRLAMKMLKALPAGKWFMNSDGGLGDMYWSFTKVAKRK